MTQYQINVRHTVEFRLLYFIYQHKNTVQYHLIGFVPTSLPTKRWFVPNRVGCSLETFQITRFYLTDEIEDYVMLCFRVYRCRYKNNKFVSGKIIYQNIFGSQTVYLRRFFHTNDISQAM